MMINGSERHVTAIYGNIRQCKVIWSVRVVMNTQKDQSNMEYEMRARFHALLLMRWRS